MSAGLIVMTPRGFVAEIDGPAIIDEIQRVPGLPLAIKQRLDSDRSRGQFLITGSANILTLPTVADALPERMRYINLWPCSSTARRHGSQACRSAAARSRRRSSPAATPSPRDSALAAGRASSQATHRR